MLCSESSDASISEPAFPYFSEMGVDSMKVRIHIFSMLLTVAAAVPR